MKKIRTKCDSNIVEGRYNAKHEFIDSNNVENSQNSNQG